MPSEFGYQTHRCSVTKSGCQNANAAAPSSRRLALDEDESASSAEGVVEFARKRLERRLPFEQRRLLSARRRRRRHPTIVLLVTAVEQG
jgi:hypothetical protein